MSFASVSKFLSRPAVALLAVAVGVGLGMQRWPSLQLLRPIGDLYIALLQVCVLPFLLATIPLAVRSALTRGSGARNLVGLGAWSIVAILATGLVAVTLPHVVFSVMPFNAEASAKVGALIGTTAASVDLELALIEAIGPAQNGPSGSQLVQIVPTNVFASLAANDSLKVVIFSVIFGAGMVAAELRSGRSIFGALEHIQGVCVLIFEWFNILMPIGVVALIAPQIAVLGPDTYAVLAPFAYAYFASVALLVLLSLVMMAIALRRSPLRVAAAMSKPLALVAATRNALICAPMTLDVMKRELRASKDVCELFIPIGFAILRFGNMAHFIVATLFVGYLLGRPFSPPELAMVAALAFVASFGTIGIAGVAGLAPLATVMRPFGLSYELALPLMIVVDPVVSITRGMINVAVGSQIAALAGGRERET